LSSNWKITMSSGFIVGGGLRGECAISAVVCSCRIPPAFIPSRARRADELPDGVDNDCDGEVDEDTDLTDDDGDGLSEADGDCDDSDAEVYPGHPEVPGNGIDDDCDGLIDEDPEDLDGDGYAVDDGDCDDTDGWANPGRSELCGDGVDNDCDGEIDEDCEAFELTPKTDSGGATKDAGCGCNSGQGQAGWLLLLGLVAARRRRHP